MDIFISVVLVLLAFLFVLLGAQFRRGKWLRLIAGNTFGDLPADEAVVVGRKTGIVMYVSAILCLFVWWWLFYSENQVLLWWVLAIFLILCGILLFTSLRNWVKTGR